MSQTKLDILVDILKDAPDEVFIQPHNVPDPDAIASSLGLYYLLSKWWLLIIMNTVATWGIVLKIYVPMLEVAVPFNTVAVLGKAQNCQM